MSVIFLILQFPRMHCGSLYRHMLVQHKLDFPQVDYLSLCENRSFVFIGLLSQKIVVNRATF